MVATLRARLEGPVQQSLTRLTTLAELRQPDCTPESADARRYDETRLDEARFLAQTVHRKLLALRG